MLEHLLQRLRVLPLCDGSIGFEDVLDGGVHAGLKCQINERVLNKMVFTARFWRWMLQVIFLLAALVRYS